MYIRTKDGVYDTNKHHYEIEIDVLYEIVWDDPYTEYGVNGKYSRGKVIAQSENLEELCDQIVYNGYLYQNKITWDGRLIEDSFEELDDPITDEMIKEGIYGAIWTDKGLIYVAKMNESGELELI